MGILGYKAEQPKTRETLENTWVSSIFKGLQTGGEGEI